ncbi:hypothetical protein ES708_33962 [subsurface metagenome]
MKINKYFFTLLCILSLLCISCEKFLDVNEPPGSPGTVAITETAVLPSLLASWYGDNWEQVDIVRFWILQNVTDAKEFASALIAICACPIFVLPGA